MKKYACVFIGFLYFSLSKAMDHLYRSQTGEGNFHTSLNTQNYGTPPSAPSIHFTNVHSNYLLDDTQKNLLQLINRNITNDTLDLTSIEEELRRKLMEQIIVQKCIKGIRSTYVLTSKKSEVIEAFNDIQKQIFENNFDGIVDTTKYDKLISQSAKRPYFSVSDKSVTNMCQLGNLLLEKATWCFGAYLLYRFFKL